MAEIALTEFERTSLKRHELSVATGRQLWETYGAMIDVEFPSPATGDAWVLRPRGNVGYLPLAGGSRVSIATRTPVGNIFRMWQVAFGSAVPHLLEGQVRLQSLDDVFSWVVEELARGTQDQIRRGLYRSYVTEAADLQVMRGRINLNEMAARPWRVSLPCEFQELTADVEDNQLLAVALHYAVQSASAGFDQRSAMHAYRGLVARSVSTEPLRADHCLDREYNRLNQGYQSLHWLAHFILSNTGPSQPAGSSPTRPFIIDMPRLFERFVARWLRRHGLPGMFLEEQEKLPLHQSIEFIPDLVVRDRSGKARIVLDTKYKIGSSLVHSDVAQVVAYAAALGCQQAVLIYPSNAQPQVDTRIGTVRLRSLSFCLDGDLDESGRRLLALLFGDLARS